MKKMIRVLGGIVGVMCIGIPILLFFLGEEVTMEEVGIMPLGLIFLAYAIGGQKLLKRVVPDVAEKDRDNITSK